jgi:hypothetical protein
MRYEVYLGNITETKMRESRYPTKVASIVGRVANL